MEPKGFRNAVSSRGRNEPFNGRTAVRFVSWAGTVVRACRSFNPDDGSATIRYHTEGRGRRDLDIAGTRMEKFENGIGDLNDGLGRPRTRKGIGYVHERIGKLKSSTRAGKRFRLEVVPRADDPSKAASVKCERVEVPGSKADCPGVSCIRTNGLSLETAGALRLYFSLAEIESVFRSLKPELGLSPFFRGSGRRTDAHVCISCPACGFVDYIRKKLKAAGTSDSRAAVRNRPETRKTATVAVRANGMDANAGDRDGHEADRGRPGVLQGHGQRPGGPQGEARTPQQLGREARRRPVTGQARLPAQQGPGRREP
jgi:hypothetical protein